MTSALFSHAITAAEGAERKAGLQAQLAMAKQANLKLSADLLTVLAKSAEQDAAATLMNNLAGLRQIEPTKSEAATQKTTSSPATFRPAFADETRTAADSTPKQPPVDPSTLGFTK